MNGFLQDMMLYDCNFSTQARGLQVLGPFQLHSKTLKDQTGPGRWLSE